VRITTSRLQLKTFEIWNMLQRRLFRIETIQKSNLGNSIFSTWGPYSTCLTIEKHMTILCHFISQCIIAKTQALALELYTCTIVEYFNSIFGLAGTQMNQKSTLSLQAQIFVHHSKRVSEIFVS